MFASGLALMLGGLPATVAIAQDQKPYDERLLRLSEILGSVHYLRELCGGADGQTWRDRMQDIINAEGSSALRRVKFARSFNQGYRSYNRTYNACTPSAEAAIAKFMAEAVQIAETLVKTIP